MRLKHRPLASTAAVQTLEQREPERQVSFEEALRLVRPHQQLLEALYRPPRAPTSAAGVQTAGFDSFYDVLWLVHKFERDIELYLRAAHPPPPKPLLLPAAAQTDAAAPKLTRTVQQQTSAPVPVPVPVPARAEVHSLEELLALVGRFEESLWLYLRAKHERAVLSVSHDAQTVQPPRRTVQTQATLAFESLGQLLPFVYRFEDALWVHLSARRNPRTKPMSSAGASQTEGERRRTVQTQLDRAPEFRSLEQLLPFAQQFEESLWTHLRAARPPTPKPETLTFEAQTEEPAPAPPPVQSERSAQRTVQVQVCTHTNENARNAMNSVYCTSTSVSRWRSTRRSTRSRSSCLS